MTAMAMADPRPRKRLRSAVVGRARPPGEIQLLQVEQDLLRVMLRFALVLRRDPRVDPVRQVSSIDRDAATGAVGP